MDGDKNVFKLKTFCLITGSSKGLGRSIAVKLAAKAAANSVFLLVARSEDGLQKTASAIREIRGDSINVQCVPMDLAIQDDNSLRSMINNGLEHFKTSVGDFQQALIVHNAAALGDVSKRYVEFSDAVELNKYWTLTLSSTTVLNTVFLEVFSCPSVKQRITINISSICSLQAFKSWSLYCAGKAARDMLFKTMALENPELRVLNYAPGPVDTDMQVLARTQTADDELRTMFKDMKDGDKLLSCDQSVDKLVRLLEENTFDTGAHIDYYDL